MKSHELAYGLDPVLYVQSLGFKPFEWQKRILRDPSKRIVVNGARQSGKSTIVSALPCHRARFFPGSLSIILAAKETQAKEDLRKVKAFVSLDKDYPKLEESAADHITLSNGSRIVVVTATESSARGYSSPDIIVPDEASRIDEEVIISGILPMLTDNAKCKLVVISTPHGKSGFFYRAFNSRSWTRYEVKAPWHVTDLGDFEPAEPEDEYVERMADKGIIACYSPRHQSRESQQQMLTDMGSTRMYRQECEVEFVEPQDQVFSYEDIEAMRNGGRSEALVGAITESERRAI